MEEKESSDKAIICPHCEGHGYQDADIPLSPCITCGASGWLTKSELEEWEAENSPVDWMDEV